MITTSDSAIPSSGNPTHYCYVILVVSFDVILPVGPSVKLFVFQQILRNVLALRVERNILQLYEKFFVPGFQEAEIAAYCAEVITIFRRLQLPPRVLQLRTLKSGGYQKTCIVDSLPVHVKKDVVMQCVCCSSGRCTKLTSHKDGNKRSGKTCGAFHTTIVPRTSHENPRDFKILYASVDDGRVTPEPFATFPGWFLMPIRCRLVGCSDG